MLNGALRLSPRSAGKRKRRRLAALHNPPGLRAGARRIAACSRIERGVECGEVSPLSMPAERENRRKPLLLNRLQRFGSLGDVGANLVFALVTGEGPDEGGRTRGSPLPAVLSRIAEAYLEGKAARCGQRPAVLQRDPVRGLGQATLRICLAALHNPPGLRAGARRIAACSRTERGVECGEVSPLSMPAERENRRRPPFSRAGPHICVAALVPRLPHPRPLPEGEGIGCPRS